jgi:hypothetical protein
MGGGYDYSGIHSICTDPRDSNRLIAGVSVGGVWRTNDAGASFDHCSAGMWAAYLPPERMYEPNAQDPHRVVRCRAEPDVLWAQHHNGIFRSTDCAKSWTEITSRGKASFGFAVAAHPRDPETAWFVPAIKDELRVPPDGALAVARTRDGGKSFEHLRKGLPQTHAYDLIYRHGLDIDRDGARIALGSTTGSLWAGDADGDSFELITHHLPPIYCVRFD